MTSHSTAFVVLALGIGLGACAEQPTAPTRSPIRASVVADDSAPAGRLLFRSDSLSRTGNLSWFDGTLTYYVFVHESQMPGERTAFFGYGAYDLSYQTRFFGYGTIPTSDLTGSGIGDLRVRTNTAAIPGFVFFNDSGGPVDITWKQVPHTAFKMHFVTRFEWPPFLFVGTGRDMGRAATATGAFAWRAIPDSAQASMYQSLAHSMVFLMPGY